MQLPVPENEDERLRALQEYNILDSLPQEQFDRLTKLASIIGNVPIALLCLIDKDRQWFKSKIGVSMNQYPRESSFCQYTIMGKGFLEIEDTHTDSRFKDSPVLLQQPNIRYYAGFPLIDPNGYALGTICLLDKKPNKLSESQKESLRILSEDIVVQIINNKGNNERIKLEKFFEMSLDMICIADMKGYFKKINPAFTKILGWTETELLEKSFIDLIHPHDVENTYKELEKLSSGKKTLDFTNRYRTKNGRYILLDWVANPDMESGEVFAIARDITFLTKIIADFEVFSSEKEQLNQALNESTIVSITDQNGKIKFVNDAFCEISKYSREELIGNDHHILNSGFHSSEFFNNLWKTLAKGKIWKGEIKNIAKDGSVFWVDTTVVPFVDNNNQSVRNIFIRHDITQRVLLEEALRKSKEEIEKSSQIKEQFLANMSHEIRTPLNAIIGFSEILINSKLNIEQKENVGIISMAGETLMRIINDILDFTRIESGNIILEKNPLNLFLILEYVKKIFSKSAEEKNIELKVFTDNDIPSNIVGDPVRITQILVNLVGNAIKFTNNGKVTIYCNLQSKKDGIYNIEFKIKDTGIGIPEEKLELIFERFVQAEDNTSRKYGGTGLGLSITKTLVELFGGKIFCKSIFGKGSEFTVLIPFEKTGDDSAEEIENIDQLDIDPKVKILLVEDHVLNQKLTDKIITTAGSKLDIAENGKAAISMLEKQTYDIILLDLQMPEMDGYATADYIRNVLKLNVPIIAMTANALQGEKEKCLRAGMDDYISKPFKAPDLIHTINSFLGQKRIVTKSISPEKRKVILSNNGNQLYNLNGLNEISGNDKKFNEEFITSFKVEIENSLISINEYFLNKEYDKIKRTAHKIKSSLGLLNNKEASILCDEIEHLHSNDNLRSKISDLNLAIGKLLVALNKDFSN